MHRLQGTRSQAKDEQADDSKVFTEGRLKMPAEYKTDPLRVAAWKKLFSPLHRRRTMTKADSAIAELLVEEWILWQTVNAEAQARPFSDVFWIDKNGDEHSKRVESPASKMAASLQRSLTQKLKEFSATPASREKTKKTKEPALRLAQLQSETERLDEEIAELQAQKVEESKRDEEQAAAELESINLEDLKI
jgi:phage terminase small subunit